MVMKAKMVKKLTLVLGKKVVSIFLKIRPATHLPLIHPHIKFQPFRPIILGDMASLHLRISRILVLYEQRLLQWPERNCASDVLKTRGRRSSDLWIGGGWAFNTRLTPRPRIDSATEDEWIDFSAAL